MSSCSAEQERIRSGAALVVEAGVAKPTRWLLTQGCKSTARYWHTGTTAIFAPAASHVAGTGPHSMRARSLAEEKKTGRITFQREVGGSFVFSSKWRGKKDVGVSFSSPLSLAERAYYEPRRQVKKKN